ncbi:MAG: YraN family protein [Candidatus Aminicenantes bacterium]|nr:YraN family protein [Candidatus Aminicenantes bacterium]
MLNLKRKKLLSGSQGEEAAARYLERKGYKIIEQNYRACGSEIDLIAQYGDTLCFIEVKTRKTDDFGLPAEFVDFRKRKKIIRGARVFTGRKKYAEMYVRFDIVAVIYEGRAPVINHIENAFEEE